MIVKSFDGNEFGTDYVAVILGGGGISLPGGAAQVVKRTGAWPLVSGMAREGRALGLGIAIEGSDVGALRDQLFQWFDPEDETPKKLAITDAAGTNERYLYVQVDGDIVPRDVPQIYVVPLKVHGDVRWRAEAGTVDVWNITASGQTHQVENGGANDAWPSFEIKPVSAKSGGFAYKEFWSVTWRSENPGFSYPARLGPIDTAALVGAGKMQADGDDLRVYVDGREVDRWLDGMNSANTYVWVVLDFSPRMVTTLRSDIASSGAISSIEVGEEIYDFRDGVILRIDDELFFATTRDLSDEKFTGITRGWHGTSEAGHTAGARVHASGAARPACPFSGGPGHHGGHAGENIRGDPPPAAHRGPGSRGVLRQRTEGIFGHAPQAQSHHVRAHHRPRASAAHQCPGRAGKCRPLA